MAVNNSTNLDLVFLLIIISLPLIRPILIYRKRCLGVLSSQMVFIAPEMVAIAAFPLIDCVCQVVNVNREHGRFCI